MSIASALNSALSGLTATSRRAEILSSNVANALTPGYARREVGLRAAVLGGTGQGVSISGIIRHVDKPLLADRRLAQAGDADRNTRASFLARVERTLGTPDSPGSLAARLAAFDAALVEAAGRPESQAKLGNVLATAKSLIAGMATATRDIQAARMTADRQIAEQVDLLTSTLQKVHDLNVDLQSFTGAGRDISALLDERQRLVDRVASIVPLREVERQGNQIALFTLGGAPLLEGNPVEIGFVSTPTITPDMTQALGGLSGITLNGRPFETSGPTSPILGGSLGALFAVRDDLATGAQGKLDAMARDLVERFADPALDPTRAPGAPGLFTDAGAAFLPVDEAGIAGRLRINAAVDPAEGGALFRLRDGLGAVTEGPPGDGTLLNALHGALTGTRALASGGFPAGLRSFAGLTAEILSDTASRRLSGEADQAFASARLNALADLEAQNGIDTDQEMQALLTIEKHYAANARVIQTVDELMDILIRLGQ